MALLRRSALVVGLAVLLSWPALAEVGIWRAEGPAPIRQGNNVENIEDNEQVGAVQALAPDPANGNVLFIGAVNGGVWRTDDALAEHPTWRPLTDTQDTLSIGALEFDPTDRRNQTLVAGIGRFSNIQRAGGTGAGVLRTSDGGATWTALGQAALAGTNISGVAPRGSTIVVADTNRGIWRSTDTGANWTRISGLAGSGLPTGGSLDLAGVPGTPGTLYTNAGNNGVFISTDTGATWRLISNAAMNALAPVSNLRISAPSGTVVFVAIAQPLPAPPAGQAALTAVFRSGDSGTNWAQMDLPQTNEGAAGLIGIHPGGQANPNLSLAADPFSANGTIVYIGGDAQPGPFPNSIGANRFSARLFRGDSSQPAGQQFVHLTHSNSQGPAGGGTLTGTSPHPDSRVMAVDANGNLIEGNDGGVYRRTLPQTSRGDWVSANGDLQTTEFHSIAWDAVSNRILGGAQDNGTPEQLEVEQAPHRDIRGGDGSSVAVDDISTPGQSTRFFSSQRLNGQANTLSVRTYDEDNALISQTTAPLTVLAGGPAITAQFYTPVVVNNADGTRLIVGAGNAVYESLDAGQTVTAIGPGIAANSSIRGESIGYGAADNVDMLYVGSVNQVFVRNGASPGATLTASATYPGANRVVDVAIDPGASQTAYVVDTSNVFQTLDAGATWTNVTGDLFTSFRPGQLRSVDVISVADLHAVVVGTDRGVFWADALPLAAWSVPCSGIPNAPVTDLEYDEADEVLVAGTLGRGAWSCAPARPRPMAFNMKFVCGKGDDRVLAAGTYTTAINILNRDAEGAAPSTYRRQFTVGLPGEAAGGTAPLQNGATLAPGEAAELDCDDILAEAGRLCPGTLCKGFVQIDSPAPLDIVAVYSSENPERAAVADLTLTRQPTPGLQCTETVLKVPEHQELLVPPHTQGDSDFGGHGPCMRLTVNLHDVDDGSALALDYDLNAYECSGSFTAPRADFTAARGGRSQIVALAGPGGRIVSHTLKSSQTIEVIDTDHADATLNFADPELISTVRLTGDTSGDEAGSRTGAFITFRAQDVRLQTCSLPSNAG
ncbi:MAG: exo-alpha-sialidase [Rhodobacteraceae bacterium]|nr:exo-alpha-sialidase [Paracoccaceae bacterium]